jgi:hypothetical protein
VYDRPEIPWAKLSRDQHSSDQPGIASRGAITGWLSLVDHSADVAAVFEAILTVPTCRKSSWRPSGGTAKSQRKHAVEIERLAAGTYLELYGRQTVAGWHVWGNEIPAKDFGS